MSDLNLPTDQKEILHVQRWLEEVVIELNLCPFAKREFINKRIRFTLSTAQDEENLLADLEHELGYLQSHAEIETSVLVHPQVLNIFSDYNQFLDLADALLESLNLVGILQVASFHPDYQFAETAFDDVENYTNRSPYPLLHILREESLSRAVDSHPDVDRIPQDNIALMNQTGLLEMRNKYFRLKR